MVRLFIALLIIVLPANALAAVSCCADIKPTIQTEKPCHEKPDIETGFEHECIGCVFCVTGLFFMSDSYENGIGILAAEEPESILFLISYLLYLPFRPPKSV